MASLFSVRLPSELRELYAQAESDLVTAAATEQKAQDLAGAADDAALAADNAADDATWAHVAANHSALQFLNALRGAFPGQV